MSISGNQCGFGESNPKLQSPFSHESQEETLNHSANTLEKMLANSLSLWSDLPLRISHNPQAVFHI